MKVKKAIIPAAGLGTRFLPATKAQPKEMLPIVDKPTIQYIVEEAVASGIESILIVTGRSKRSIEDHFDKSVELEAELKLRGKWEELEQIKDISNLVDIHYVRQKEAKGLGHAIYCARAFIGDEPFAVMLGDDVLVSEDPALRQLMCAYEQYETSVLGVRRVEQKAVSSYGIVAVDPAVMDDPHLHRVRDLVEKPPVGRAPSNIAIVGRYIITPEIFSTLEKTKPGAGGEIQLTDALQALLHRQPMYALEMQCERYDIGDKLNFLVAQVEFALARKDLKDDFKAYLRKLMQSDLMK